VKVCNLDKHATAENGETARNFLARNLRLIVIASRDLVFAAR
jgi:hypothetical protein